MHQQHCIFPSTVNAFCKLALGEFPGRHSMDYLSKGDVKKVGKAKPQLVRNHSNHRIQLYLNVAISSTSTLESFTGATAHSGWFQIVVKGLNLTGAGPKLITHTFRSVDVTELQDLYLLTATSSDLHPQASLTFLSQPFTLWLCTRFGLCDIHSILHSAKQINGLLLTSDTTDLQSVFDPLSKTDCVITALTVLRAQSTSLPRQLNEQLGVCLLNLCNNLKYLQLRSWLFTSMPLDALKSCSYLRVLSITESPEENGNSFTPPLHTVSNILNMLLHLSHLEFFEWSETINMRTPDLLSLHSLLLDALPNLRHWHMSLSFLLLSTTDLENAEYGAIASVLVPFLQDKWGDESCTTYRFSLESETFKHWISSLRPDVCFRVNKKSLHADLLHFMY